ncbi:hypothetical protein P0136_02300 [Lentisphaerota bacterium ZTH]|nr:hypothetical protein JYG24_06560 [Lentisphaerota bacterium]WET06832.1 hypothetical protein P0136_02300 [Lentisphaerota bacterium ZTH]
MEKRISRLEEKMEELLNAVRIIGDAGNRRERNVLQYAVNRRQFDHMVDFMCRKHEAVDERLLKLESKLQDK